jgi:hypothetical protein
MIAEPKTLEEAKQLLADAFRKQGNATLAVFLDQLVDLACRGGSPIADNLFEYKKLAFYKRTLAQLAGMGIL